jgi:hypothetical protein
MRLLRAPVVAVSELFSSLRATERDSMSSPAEERKPVEYGWSNDEEVYYGHFPTREAALDEGRESDEDATIWTGRCIPLDLGRFVIPGAYLIEHIQDAASDEFPWDLLDGIPAAAADALTDRVRAAFVKWMADFKIKSDYYTVEHVVEHKPLKETMNE